MKTIKEKVKNYLPVVYVKREIKVYVPKDVYNIDYIKNNEENKREKGIFCDKCGLKTYTIEKEETKEDGIN